MNDLISRKAVLSILHNKAFDSVKNDEKYNLLRWCMKQIESLPTIQPQGIDKERLIDGLRKWQAKTLKSAKYEDAVEDWVLDEVIDFINQQPTTD